MDAKIFEAVVVRKYFYFFSICKKEGSTTSARKGAIAYNSYRRDLATLVIAIHSRAFLSY
jgi:hypothetical protein